LKIWNPFRPHPFSENEENAMENQENKQLSTFGYGLVGVAAIGAISILLLSIIIAGAPNEQVAILPLSRP
jgi:hypothetical protein